MWKLKACPRCGGDVVIDTRSHIRHEQCLQCGYQHDLRAIREFKEEPKYKRGPALTRTGRTSKK